MSKRGKNAPEKLKAGELYEYVRYRHFGKPHGTYLALILEITPGRIWRTLTLAGPVGEQVTTQLTRKQYFDLCKSEDKKYWIAPGVEKK